jgi:hypothetical protein
LESGPIRPEPLAQKLALEPRPNLELSSIPIAIEAVILSHELKQGPLSKKGQEIPVLKLLFNRSDSSQAQSWELPKRFLWPSERLDLDQLALSLVQEITGAKDLYFEQLLTYLDSGVDFQAKVLCCAYLVLIPAPLPPKIDSLCWVELQGQANSFSLNFPTLERKTTYQPNTKPNNPDLNDFPPIMAALNSIRKNIRQTNLLANLMPQTFRIRHLQSLFDLLRGEQSSAPNFRRVMCPKLTQTDEFVTDKSCRPSRLFRFKDQEN